MATLIQLASGLNGAIGCDFRQAQNQLVFVEYGGNLSRLNLVPAPTLTASYAVLGSGYAQPEDVKVSVDDLHAYVTERSGDLVRVLLTSANRSAATVVASGMTAPQQLFLDEAHQAAYTVEYANPGHLWRINLATGVKTSVVSTLNLPIGLVLSADRQYAYVSLQAGQIICIQLSNGAITTLVSGLTNPFFLTWADAAQTTLLVTERDPANLVTSINVTTGATNVIVSGVPARPSSVAMPNAGLMLICSNSVIDAVQFGTTGLLPTGPLLIGIGFIPFTAVAPSGLATTAAGYIYQVTNAPFGGTLPLMINYQRAAAIANCAYYRVLIDPTILGGAVSGGTVRTDSWSDYWWNGTTYILKSIGPASVAGQPGYYAIRQVSDLFNWMNPTLGMMMDSTNLTNALHSIVVEFTDVNGHLLATSLIANPPSTTPGPLIIMVNNQSCVATLAQPTLNNATADTVCGLLHYGTPSTTPVMMGFSAYQPANYATYSFALYKGVNPVALPGPPPAIGPVSAATISPPPFQGPVNSLLGTCTIAGFAEELYVYATMTNGWNRQSQYDASALIAFVLAP
jgi:hypothetical protein